MFSFQKAHSETKLLVHSSSTRNQRLQLQHLPLLHPHLLLLFLDLLVLLLPGLVAQLVRGEQVTPTPLSQRQTSNGMTKPMMYHKTHTAWQKTYCMSFAMPSYFPWIHGKTHVISAPPYPWLFPCSNLSLVSQLFAFDRTF